MKYCLLVVFALSINLRVSSQSIDEKKYFQVDYIQSLISKVADWQLNHLQYESSGGKGDIGIIHDDGWIRGTLYSGILSTYYTTGNRKYLDCCNAWAERNKWMPGNNKRHADDQTVGQVYTELYLLQGGEEKINALRDNFDLMLTDPLRGKTSGWSKSKNWSWCDALFMAPPAMARMFKATGEEKYLDLIDLYYWDTYNLLFDKKEKLFYRDENYIYNEDKGPKTQNGKKIFWARGNGWVLAGLARTLEYMPRSYQNRDKYVALFKEMSEKVIELQQIDGLWRSSLLDPWQFPEKETSSSSLFCFALAWGINNGLLNKDKYEVPVERAWISLVECIDCDGELGWVQSVGHEPQHIRSSDTMEYGVGAFLLAAREIYKFNYLNTNSH